KRGIETPLHDLGLQDAANSGENDAAIAGGYIPYPAILPLENSSHEEDVGVGEVLDVNPIKVSRFVQLEAVPVLYDIAHNDGDDDALRVEEALALTEDAGRVEADGLDAALLRGCEDADLCRPLWVWVRLVFGFEEVVYGR